MILLAVVLLIIGVVLLLLPVPLSNKDNVGWLFIALAVILLIVALLLSAADGGHLNLDTARSSWSLVATTARSLWS